VRYFLDTEFVEDGRTIDLISVGIVSEDGREFYRGNIGFVPGKAPPWHMENVVPHLPAKTRCSNCEGRGFFDYGNGCRPCSRRGVVKDGFWTTRDVIAQELVEFTDPEKHGRPEFWAYYADYDWVVLCQLFGRMIDLPEHFPKLCLDLKQQVILSGMHKHWKPVQKDEHDALADARWNRELFRVLEQWKAYREWEAKEFAAGGYC